MPNIPLTTSAMSELAIAANGNGIGRAANANSNANGLAAGENPVVNAWKRYEGLKNVDDAKNQLIEELIFRYEYMAEQYRKVEAELQRDKIFYSSYHQSKAALEAENNRLTESIMRQQVVLVLIDGDGMIFHDQLLSNAASGGSQAAKLLHDSTLIYVNELLEGQPHIPSTVKVVARMYADLQGLANTCYKAGIVPSMDHVLEFARGFSAGQVLFDFVDVGAGNDWPDEKINETLEMYIKDVHCLQVFLGCSHGKGYTRVLDKYMYDLEARTKITLLEGVPFEEELVTLIEAAPFQSTRFGSLFRHKKINLGQNAQPSWVPLNETALRAANNSNGIRQHRDQTPSESVTSSRSPSVAVNSWAAKLASAPAPPDTPPSTKAKPALPASKGTSASTVPRNRKGQRVDANITRYDKGEVDRIKRMKMCNVHFLRRECPYGDKCTHRHDYKPNNDEIEWLRVVARMAACRFGSACDDVKCIYGHRCQAPERMDKSKMVNDGGKTCIFASECVFPRELHNMDCTVVRTTKV